MYKLNDLKFKVLPEYFVQKLEEPQLSTYRPFLIRCYNIQCTVLSFVIIIVVFIFISKYLYRSCEMLLLLSYFCLMVKSDNQINHLLKLDLVYK